MLLKRLSIALCALMCFSGFVMGTNTATQPYANKYGEENTLLAPLALGAQITPNDISYYDEGDGSFDIVVTEGVAPYSFQLRDLSGNLIPGKSGNTNNDIFSISGLAAGSYRVHISDGSGGQPWTSPVYVINEPSQVTVDLLRIEPIQCNGQFGEMEFEANSDAGGYRFYARNTDLSQNYDNLIGTFTGIPRGNYNVWVVDANNCQGYYTGDVPLRFDEPSDLNIVNVVPNQISCFNELGSASITGLPENIGINAYNVSLTNNRTGSTSYSLTSNNIYTNLDYGTYTLTVSRNGCTPVTRNFEIFQFDEVEIAHSVIGSILCYGEKVEVDVQITGGKIGGNLIVYLISNDGDETNDVNSPLINYGASHTFTNVSDGSYTIKAVDNNNLDCFVTKPFNIAGPTNPLVYDSAPFGIGVSCNGEADGTIQFSVSGGETPYRYEVDGTIYNNPGNISLAANTYSVRVIDANNCPTELLQVDITQPNQVVATLVPGSKTDVTCPEGNDGSFAIKITGGTGSYYYDLAGPVIRNNASASDSLVVSNLSAGLYDVTIRDENDCQVQVLGIEVDGPDPLTISDLTFDNLVCPGSTTDISVSASGGGVPSYTYQLYKAETLADEKTGSSAIFTDVTPSVYKLRIIGNAACAVLDTLFEIKTSQPIGLISFSDSIMARCADADGEIHIQASGQYPFHYQLDDFTSTPIAMGGGVGATVDIAGLAADFNGYAHKIRIIDDNGCSKDYDFTVYAPQALENTDPIVTPVSCYGNRDGKVEVTISGGSPNYTATIGSRNEAADENGLIVFENMGPSATAYLMSITDSKGCTINGIEVLVEQPTDMFMIANPVIQTPVQCYGEKGEVIISTTGGWPTANQTIRVRGEGTDTIINNNSSLWIKQGTYTASAINADGCSAGKQFVVPGPTQVRLQASSTNVTCNGADDATITINASGGSGNYFYGLGGTGSASTSFAGNQFVVSGGISIGDYNVLVQDDLGCESNIVPISITEPAPITFETIVVSVSGFGGNNGRIRIIKVEGGSGEGYRSYISTGGTETQGTLTINGLVKNTYSVVVSDNSGTCRSEAVSISIEEPNEIVISNVEVEHIQCFGVNEGIITINAQGGAPYGLQYRITRDPNFDSGYSDSNQFTMLAPGVYTVRVRNTKGNCEQQYDETVTINNAAELIVNTPIITDVSCHNLHDGQAIIGASGGTGQLTFTLTNTAPVISNTDGIFTGLGEDNRAVTSYDYIVEDINGCSKTGSFQVRNPEPIALTITGRTEILCNNNMNGTLSLMVTGGTVTAASGYTLSDYDNPSINYEVERISANEFTISGLGNTGTVAFYNPVATDNNGCQTDPLAAPEEFVNPAKVVIDSVSQGEKLCYGDTNDRTIIYASGGTGKFYYSLDNGATLSELQDSVFVGETVGLKQPYVIDENNCEATAESYEYEQPERFEVEYEFFPIQCYDDQYGDMQLEIKGGTGNYELSINAANFDVVGDVHTIDRSQSDVTNYGLLENDIRLADNKTYYFYLRDANGCHVQNVEGVNNFTKPFADTIFTIPEKLVLVGLEMRSVNCRNENTGVIMFEAEGGTVTAEQGYKLEAYNLDRNQSKFNANGSNQVDKLFAGLHRCWLTDANGCVAETKLTPFGYDFDTISVAYANESIYLEISNIVVPTCDITYDGLLEINVADYSQDGVTAYVERLNPKLNIYDPFDEQDTIVADPDYQRVINEDNILYFANSVQIADHMGIGRYLITVEDNYTGCATSLDTLIISRDGDDCPALNNYNAFTPHNGDMLNENFTVFGSQYQEYTLQVYTSWGELVYSDEGVADGEGVKWNGVDNSGRPVPVGTYIYWLHKQLSAQQDTTIINNITILRGDGRR